MRNRLAHGFSLVELAVVLVIVSVLATGAITVARSQDDAARWQIARDRMEAIDTAIQTYFTAHRYLPCPASTRGVPNTAAFGVTTDCANSVASPQYVLDKTVSGLGNDIVRTGSIPTRSLDLPDSYGVDPWGNRFMLVEVAYLATTLDKSVNFSNWSPTVSYPNGPIRIVDANNNQITDSGSANVVAYVIICFGPDGFTGTGGSINPMTGQNGSVAANGGFFQIYCGGTQDAENCDSDSDTIYRDQRYDSGLVSAALHYDDLILWRLKSTLQ